MPHTHTTTVYDFAELSDKAKERAREQMRDTLMQDFTPDATLEDAATFCEIIGITLDTRPVTLRNGGTRHEPQILYSGFSSQGDGASFEGHYAYKAGCAKQIRQHAPLDTRLHAIVDRLVAAQKPTGYALTASVKRADHHYCHEHTARIEVYDRHDDRVPEAIEDMIAEALRDLMRWIYRQLEAEWEYALADEQVDDTIEANEYEFTEDGRIA